MISFFSLWAKQIIIAVVISSIIEMILPNNKNKKYVKMVMGIYILFSIISPIINQNNLFSFDNLNLESYAVTNENLESNEINQESMNERLKQLYIKELENDIKKKVKERGFKVHSCKVDAVLTGDENKQGINKIYLVVSKDEEYEDAQADVKNKSNVKSVDNVDVRVGLDKFFDKNTENSEDDTCDELQVLKNELSNYYELDLNKIHIRF